MPKKSITQDLLNKLRQSGRLLGILLAAWLLAACASNQQAPSEGDPAPNFSLEATGGGSVSLSEYQGKQPVLLYFHMAVG
jgi:uncharacterized lipoprotein YajG